MTAQEPGDTPEEPEDAEFEALLDVSSLGAPHVVGAAESIPPERRARFQRAQLLHLLGAPARSGAQLRRIAELTELLFDDDAARIWWQRAAAAGDQDAVDMLAQFEAEAAGEPSGPSEEDLAYVDGLLARSRLAPLCVTCDHGGDRHADGRCFRCEWLGRSGSQHPYRPREL
ncbi:hypothetical protein ABZS76_32905 [Streptomyces sp. NPDC005562]|uniref:hypothetical protein n=1 Tax=Streptomyces sp. NPDC005562 TaxID=3154890 RepID=UPI0033A86429